LIAIDANLLIYAKFSDLPQHPRALPWLEEVLNSPGRVGLPWPSLLAFLRLATNARLFREPLTINGAWDQVDEWLGVARVWIPQPTEHHGKILADLLTRTQATGNLVPDAHLAALAIEHGLTLCSADADFARFPGLDWFNPLA
jgi:toxin-antitoxin system PIN domain toxin